jgi:6-phosphogluconolactonase/glucosamine-6-phosphate isomerase/deaminase
VVVAVSGAEKRDAIARIRAGEDLPAARIRAPEVIWLVDPDALG